MTTPKITIINKNGQPDNCFTVSGVFWLSDPTGSSRPSPKFVSQVKNLPADAEKMLSDGFLVEIPFTTGLFSNDTLDDVIKQDILRLYSEAASSQYRAAPGSTLDGLIFDGLNWVSPTAAVGTPSVIGTSYTTRFLTWADWVAARNARSCAYQLDESQTSYRIWFYDGPEVYVCTIWKGVVPAGDQKTNDSAKAEFEVTYKAGANASIDKLDTTGRQVVVNAPRVGDEVIYTTHNLCDPCTWFGSSVRVPGEKLTDSGDHLTFTSKNVNWIDMVSGRLQDDDGLVAEQMQVNPTDPHGYQVVGKVDGTLVSMREPFEASGGDYEVLWESGSVRFFSPVTGSVTFDYSYATDSTFILRPLPGKDLHIESAEADFTVDIVMTDGVEYNVYGFVDVFAPQMIALGVPSGTKIPLVSTKYKRFSNIVQEAVGAYPAVSALGSTPEEATLSLGEFRRLSRGMKTATQSMPFRYATLRELRSDLGVELRVQTTHHRPLKGESGTLTFYCTSHDSMHPYA